MPHSHNSPARAPSAQIERPSNRFLAALPDDEWQRVCQHLRPMLFHQGKILYDTGDVLDKVYFLTAGMVSLVLNSKEGTPVEVGIAGREGLVGISALLDNKPQVTQAMVQIDGTGFSLPLRVLCDEFKRGGELQKLGLCYAQHLLAQTAQAALCNRLHSIEERLCRWLLGARDRIGGGDLYLTQEFIAHMLGTRRAGVTVAMGTLRTAGFIDYSRGHIKILDATIMAETACECYHALHASLDKLYEPHS